MHRGRLYASRRAPQAFIARLYRHAAPRKSLWYLYLPYHLRYARTHAQAKDREFSLTLLDLDKQLKKQNYSCAMTGIRFDQGGGNYGYSLDRIDSERGYTADNIQFVLDIINKMKRDLSDDEFIKFCISVASFRREP